MVELLVVIVIVALMSSLVFLNLPDSKPDEVAVSDAVAARMRLANERAILKGLPLGVVMNQTGYRFLERRLGIWSAVTVGPLAGDHPWPEGALISLTLEGEKIDLSEQAEANALETVRPHLTFGPTGDMAPFRLIIDGRRGSRVIGMDSYGAIRILEGGGA